MVFFETEPNILLYACFDYKPEFDYEYEIYDCSTLIFLEEGSFHYHIDDGETMLAQKGNIIHCPPKCALHRKALTPMKMHTLRFNNFVLDRTTYMITPRIKSNLQRTAPYGLMFDPAPYPTLVHYCKDSIYADRKSVV